MKTYTKTIKTLDIEVKHGDCCRVNYNPQEISILTKENVNSPILNYISVISNGIENQFKLISKFDPQEWVRINPHMMIYKNI